MGAPMKKEELLKLAEELDALADSKNVSSDKSLLEIFRELKKEASTNVDYDKIEKIVGTIIRSIGESNE